MDYIFESEGRLYSKASVVVELLQKGKTVLVAPFPVHHWDFMPENSVFSISKMSTEMGYWIKHPGDVDNKPDGKRVGINHHNALSEACQAISDNLTVEAITNWIAEKYQVREFRTRVYDTIDNQVCAYSMYAYVSFPYALWDRGDRPRGVSIHPQAMLSHECTLFGSYRVSGNTLLDAAIGLLRDFDANGEDFRRTQDWFQVPPYTQDRSSTPRCPRCGALVENGEWCPRATCIFH